MRGRVTRGGFLERKSLMSLDALLKAGLVRARRTRYRGVFFVVSSIFPMSNCQVKVGSNKNRSIMRHQDVSALRTLPLIRLYIERCALFKLTLQICETQFASRNAKHEASKHKCLRQAKRHRPLSFFMGLLLAVARLSGECASLNFRRTTKPL